MIDQMKMQLKISPVPLTVHAQMILITNYFTSFEENSHLSNTNILSCSYNGII